MSDVPVLSTDMLKNRRAPSKNRRVLYPGSSVSDSLSLGRPISIHCAETDVNKQKIYAFYHCFVYFVAWQTFISLSVKVEIKALSILVLYENRLEITETLSTANRLISFSQLV